MAQKTNNFKEHKSSWVLIPLIFFSHISLMCLNGPNMSDIETRMLLLHAFDMTMSQTIRTLKVKLALLASCYQKNLLKIIYFKTKIIWVNYLPKCT